MFRSDDSKVFLVLNCSDWVRLIGLNHLYLIMKLANFAGLYDNLLVDSAYVLVIVNKISIFCNCSFQN